jgi:hypothetical protein
MPLQLDRAGERLDVLGVERAAVRDADMGQRDMAPVCRVVVAVWFSGFAS